MHSSYKPAYLGPIRMQHIFEWVQSVQVIGGSGVPTSDRSPFPPDII
jgi:hypothetical protein